MESTDWKLQKSKLGREIRLKAMPQLELMKTNDIVTNKCRWCFVVSRNAVDMCSV